MGASDGVSPLSRINETSPQNVPRPRTIAMINPQINSHNKLWNTVHAQETIEDVARLAMTVAKSLVGCPTPCSHSIDIRYANGMQKAECSGVVFQCNINLEYFCQVADSRHCNSCLHNQW